MRDMLAVSSVRAPDWIAAQSVRTAVDSPGRVRRVPGPARWWPKKGGMQRKGIDLPISPHNVVLLVLYTLFGRRGSTYA